VKKRCWKSGKGARDQI